MKVGRLVAIGILCMALLFSGVGTVLGATFFGVQQYTKPRGAPVTYEHTFSTPPGSYDFYIWARNGEDGSGGVKNLSISINGEEVISSSDFRAGNPLKQSVSLLPMNTITVTLKGQGGNTVFVEVGGEVFSGGWGWGW